jgi:hypothetical protein
MKIIIIFFASGLLLFACDPIQLVFVNNFSINEMQVKVSMNNDYSESDKIELNYTDTIIQYSKELIRYRFDKSIPVKLIDKNTYIATIPPKSTSLLGPQRIGFPIKKIYIESNSAKDSIVFAVKNSEMKKQLKRGRLQKVNWTYFIYNYKE